MDKRYQVFISSTYEDLKEERAEVIQALLELDCIPSGMEMFPAANEDQWTLIKRVIDESDYYLLIIGGRYGSENKEGISYTQMEYEYAQSIGKPTIAFLPKNPDDIPQGKTDKDPVKLEKLEKFKETVKSKLVKYWSNAAELGSVVSRSMIRLMKDYPGEGWVKANSVIDENSLKEIARLQNENKELKDQINSVSTEAPKGTSELAQGNDIFYLNITFTGYDTSWNDYSCNSSYGVTWNEIFEYIALKMIKACSESTIKSLINELIEKDKSVILKIVKQNYKNECIVEMEDIEIDQLSFNKIIVQLKALGLIELSNKASTSTTYWSLTPYGEYVMTKTMAIKKDDCKHYE